MRIAGKNGTSHYLVLGAGLISVNQTNAQAASVVRSHTLGMMITDAPGMKFSAGYSSATAVSVAEDAEDVRIEIEGKPGGDLTVIAPAARPEKDRKNEKAD